MKAAGLVWSSCWQYRTVSVSGGAGQKAPAKVKVPQKKEISKKRLQKEAVPEDFFRSPSYCSPFLGGAGAVIGAIFV